MIGGLMDIPLLHSQMKSSKKNDVKTSGELKTESK